MDIVESEILRAKRKEALSIALSGSVGILLLFSAASKHIGFTLNVDSVLTLYIPFVIALLGVWHPVLKKRLQCDNDNEHQK